MQTLAGRSNIWDRAQRNVILAAMDFGMGLRELVLIGVIVVVIFGATRIHASSERSNASPSQSSRWTWSDWVLLGAAVLSVSVAIALEVLKSRAT